jgi:5-methylcytosine-specific restriction enzyme A
MRDDSPRTRGRKWMRIRGQIMTRANHLCEQCAKDGKTTPAREVDHITPIFKGGTDALSNLAALCIPCHEAKTARDMGYKHKARIGLDGWPE